MKLSIQVIKLSFNKFILRKNTGIVIKKFSETMGIVYTKLAQMLATQNYGNLFTEEDRKNLSSICDECNPISYNEIEEVLKQEYGTNLDNIFTFIEKKPVGSASVSQVHRAILKSGEEVAIKIKRKEITQTIEKDIKKIRSIVHRFGKLINFSNFTGGDHALDLYLGWIKEETDFKHERENIKIYQRFANSVNGKIRGTQKIIVPYLYEEYCTDNVIVMEFIKSKTINKMELNNENKNKIVNALNSYIKSSFWAMFNDKPIVFHGDPHSGNICIDEKGNICFLDMGLLCTLSDVDAKLCRNFFLTVYSGNYEGLYNMLLTYGSISEKKKKLLKKDCEKYCEEVKEKEVTHYFIDMINVCLNYELVPPDFLFCMAKAFVCLNGISAFSDNKCTGKELLQEQTIEFLIKRSINDCKGLVISSLNILPNALKSTIKYGPINAITKIANDNDLRCGVNESIKNLNEMLALVKYSSSAENPVQQDQSKQKYKHL